MNNVIKPQIIIFDGPDKAGKSTLKAMFDKRFHFLHWTIDRGPLSHLVYNIIYERLEQNLFVNNITRICSQAILVFVSADPAVLEARIAATPGEPVIDVGGDLDTFRTVLAATLHLWKGGIMLDTTHKNPAATMEELVTKLRLIDEVCI